MFVCLGSGLVRGCLCGGGGLPPGLTSFSAMPDGEGQCSRWPSTSAASERAEHIGEMPGGGPVALGLAAGSERPARPSVWQRAQP